jgi:hypothetical protein
MSERYALIWAIAILRDDYQYTWLTISKKMGYSMTKVIHLYNQAKPHYNLEQPNEFAIFVRVNGSIADSHRYKIFALLE